MPHLVLGLDVIRSYKRLSYTIWHAIAEFIDNSTQSYFNNRDELDAAFEAAGTGLEVSVVYDRDADLLRISDNAMGMSYEELDYGLRVGARPAISSGRSQFGMGMKTAACWIGNHWTVRTKRLGDTVEHTVEVDVERVADGMNDLPHTQIDGKSPDDHYTLIEIRKHNRQFRGRTIGKIRDFLRSMYREDLRTDMLTLLWNGQQLEWDDSIDQFLKTPNGNAYRREFHFEVAGKDVTGWVGILDRGSRARAGFSILHAGRVVKGWPDSWRPEEIYGQFQGSNDLINQRLIGELRLDDFDVSHTKDDILWLGNEEEQVQKELKDVCADYIVVARTRRKTKDDERGPSELEVQTAIDEMRQEVTSAEFVDKLNLETVPPPPVVTATFEALRKATESETPVISEIIAGINVSVYLETLSVNDPYVAVDAAQENEVAVIVNMAHPHVSQIEGSMGLLNYLRHCMYDGLAEWQARRKQANLDPDTIKFLKDNLLRLSGEIEAHAVISNQP